jgi:hypothetical protein
LRAAAAPLCTTQVTTPGSRDDDSVGSPSASYTAAGSRRSTGTTKAPGPAAVDHGTAGADNSGLLCKPARTRQ